MAESSLTVRDVGQLPTENDRFPTNANFNILKLKLFHVSGAFLQHTQNLRIVIHLFLVSISF